MLIVHLHGSLQDAHCFPHQVLQIGQVFMLLQVSIAMSTMVFHLTKWKPKLFALTIKKAKFNGIMYLVLNKIIRLLFVNLATQ